MDHYVDAWDTHPRIDAKWLPRCCGLCHLPLVEKGLDMTFGDVVLFFLVAAFLICVAFAGALIVGGLLTAGVFLAKWISKKLPELWEKIPDFEDWKK